MTEPNLLLLQLLSRRYPSLHHAIAHLSAVRAETTLPRGAVHVFSDVHGEHEKLRHIINNGSGRLGPIVAELFPALDAAGQKRLLNVITYPLEAWLEVRDTLDDPEETLRALVDDLLIVLRRVARDHPFSDIIDAFPATWREPLTELLLAPFFDRSPDYLDALMAPILEHGDGPHFLRRLARVIRNLVFDEIIVAGDLGDRGPRMDKVTTYLMRQPNLRIVWGNHDVLWMGAALGHPALIATVIRISLRYGRVQQLEEGYGISLAPLTRLAETVYADDPAERFKPRLSHLEDVGLVARMQKAIAVIQFKLEEALLARHPEWDMEDRRLLSRIDLEAGAVTLPDGSRHALLDAHLPTLDPDNPTALSPEEQACFDALRDSFWESPVLWEHISFIFRRGTMYLIRDGQLIFHAAIPVDEEGASLGMIVDGERLHERDLYDALNDVILRAWRERDSDDIDRLWYLWAGPRSPLFGKDRMATFERYFIADPATHRETKNPYFKRIHEPDFCVRVLAAFGCTAPHARIINGHVPVRIEQGESPIKSERAVVIDGAFAAAYGDHGYTLLLTPGDICLAQHGHFESVDAELAADLSTIPKIQQIERFDSPRTRGDVPETGIVLAQEIEAMEGLIDAYRHNRVTESKG